MTRILVQRGSTGRSSLNLSSSSSLPGPSAFCTHQVPSAAKDGEVNEEVSELVASDEHLECSRSSENKGVKDDPLVENLRNDRNGTSSDAIAEAEKVNTLAALGSCDMMNDSGEKVASETEGSSGDPSPVGSRSSHPPPPPAPPPKPSSENLNSRRFASGSPNPVRAGSSRRAVAWPIVLREPHHLSHGLLLLDLMVRMRVTIVLMNKAHALYPPMVMPKGSGNLKLILD